MIRENYFSRVVVDRSQWMAQLLSSRPDIKEFRERVLPVDRAIEFGRLYLPDDRLLDQNNLLSLISQHLRTLGLVESQSSLHGEWDGPFVIPASFNRSQLTFLVQRGIQHAERFWNLTMPGTMPDDPNQKQLLEEISRVIGGAPIMIDDVIPLNTEKPEDSNNLTIDEEGRLTHATLNQLIWICTTNSKYKSDDLITAVCLTYSSFTKATVMFSKLRERYRLAMNECDPETRREQVKLTLNFLTTWMNQSGKQMDRVVLSAIRSFLENEVPKQFSAELLKMNESNEIVDTVDDTKAPKVELDPHHMPWTSDFVLTSLPPVEFARQLTIWTSKYFFNIKRSEFLDGSWEDIRLMHRSPNIVKLNQKMDEFSQWIQYTLISISDLNERAACMTYFIKVAKKLYKIQNYFNCLWILSAFQSNSIFKLKSTFKMIDRRKSAFLTTANHNIFTFDNVNTCIQFCDDALKSEKPVIPVLPFYLGKLTSFMKGHTNMIVVKDKINITMSMKIFKEIQGIEAFQKRKYCFYPIDQAQELIENCYSPESQEELEAHSRELEASSNIK
ncbi:RasGEF domain containing protein [Tritrichomonas foetus]|uniref:RasGEF domain containing protein n=1 Tax=Tritrichomonas foetus TaxID=1144522 RepID=A0A1J4JJX3_9EUKA|nr:RasGEF domain containing protein [Tritrichomonas foetus]|eukprot:OHS99448.1 RasGEF domain containing protein [Tritrichomonas foetus]